MPRHAVVQNNVVINTIDYDVTPNPVPGFPEDVIAIPSDTANIGWVLSDGTFTDPNGLSLADRVAEAWDILRHFRDSRLTMCDWTQAPDTALTESQVAEWQVYREALRNLPQNTVDPLAPIQWPTPPAT